MKQTPTIDRQTAELEFDRFCDAARVNLTRYRNDKDAEDFEEKKEQFIDGVMYGHIIVDDEGWPTVITECSDLKEIRFPRRPNGFDRVQMDKIKQGQSELMLFTWIGSVVKLGARSLEQLEEHDMALVRCVFNLFLDS